MKKTINKRTVVIVLGFVVMAAALIFCLTADRGDAVSDLRFTVPSEKTTESISVFGADGTDYVFLPSYADTARMSLSCPAGCEVYIGGKKYTGEGFFKDIALDAGLPLRITNSVGADVYSGTIMFKQSKNIPALSIRLVEGSLEDINASKTKTVRETGVCSLITADGTADYIGEFKNISGRGNSTWLAYKRPYNLRFKNSTSLLQMKSAEKYCLLANAYDTSSLRNKIAYDAAKELDMEYSVDCNYVDLYVDSEYLGLYMITPAVDAGDGRLVGITDLEEKNRQKAAFDLSRYDVFTERSGDTLKQGYSFAEEPDDVTGGYLVETDLSDRFTNTDGYFQLDSDRLFHIKSPRHISRAELDYISDIFAKISAADGDLSEIIDLESWAKLFLIKEFIGDTEGSSLYFYKDADSIDPKVYAGPLWDCDLTMGLAWKAQIPPDFAYFTYYGILGDVYQNPEFHSQLVSLYTDEFLPLLKEITDEKIDSYADVIRSSYDMDKIRWSTADKPFWVVQHSTIDEDAAAIKEYLTGRREFFNSYLRDGKDYVFIHLVSAHANEKYPLQYYYSVLRGEGIPELPVPEDENYIFEGWYREDDPETMVTQGTAVTENITLKAKWRLKDGSIIGKVQEVIRDYLEYGSQSELIGTVIVIGLIMISALIFLVIFIKDIRAGMRSRRSRKNNEIR